MLTDVVKHELKWRVDDESQMKVDCNERGNTFNQGGSQWNKVYSTVFDETHKVLAFRMNNGVMIFHSFILSESLLPQ